MNLAEQAFLRADCDKMQHRFGVGGRREDRAGALQFALHGHGIGDVAIVRDG
jgi:hypothetical protein